MTDNRSSTIGLLLVNLGSPDAPTQSAVKRYLREFLSDPRVIDLPRWQWLPILHGIVLNTRPKQSAKLYQSIWDQASNSSPLIGISQQITDKLANFFNQSAEQPNLSVKLAMRYGNPSIASAMQAFSDEGVENIIVLPLFPQYSATTSASVFDAISHYLKSVPVLPNLVYIRDYCQHPQYPQVLANHIKRFWAEHGQNDKLIFSYHGLPARYIDQGDIYYAHCEHTTLATANLLELDASQFIMTFQSRFGREEWIKPYTDQTLLELAENGFTSVDILSPAFAADCLETLEELAIQNKETFLAAGGQHYQYIPALNDTDEHIKLLASVVIDKLKTFIIS